MLIRMYFRFAANCTHWSPCSLAVAADTKSTASISPVASSAFRSKSLYSWSMRPIVNCESVLPFFERAAVSIVKGRLQASASVSCMVAIAGTVVEGVPDIYGPRRVLGSSPCCLCLFAPACGEPPTVVGSSPHLVGSQLSYHVKNDALNCALVAVLFSLNLKAQGLQYCGRSLYIYGRCLATIVHIIYCCSHLCLCLSLSLSPSSFSYPFGHPESP